MRPYTINGKTYYPTIVKVGDKSSGIASWYGPNFHGKNTANGEVYNMYNMTAAHKTLPMNTLVKVTNLRNQKSAVVRINDRGPFVANRIIDLSKAAAQKLNIIGPGMAPVNLEVVGFEDGGNKNKTNTSLAQNKASATQNKNNKKESVAQNRENKQESVASSIVISTTQDIVGGNFMVQIGAFKNKSGADKYKKDYAKDGYKVVIRSYEIDGALIYRVFLSGFRSEDEARDYARSGKISGAFIVRE